jgi:hypothetical protein
MKGRCVTSSLSASAILIAFLLPQTTFSQQAAESALRLKPQEEKAAYDIYSMLLRAEMNMSWAGTTLKIQQETQPSAERGLPEANSCLQFATGRESVYGPLLADYILKNRKALPLDREFDLRSYELVAKVGSRTILGSDCVFLLSAVGFNPDGTRAFVCVSHRCANHGGGRCHLLVKTGGKWVTDGDGGVGCGWGGGWAP